MSAAFSITSERLLLRRFAGHDTKDLLDLVSDPAVARVIPEIKADEADIIKYIDRQNSYEPFERGKCFDLAIDLKKESKVIGLLTLVVKEHRQGQIGWVLNVDYRRKGYATEAARALIEYAFKKLGLHRIYAVTSDINISSWKLMERVGMRREGHHRETERRDGHWIDTLVYGILAGE